MRDYDAGDIFLLLIITVCLTGVITTMTTNSSLDKTWEQDAIKHNAGHYNQTTGKFQWNDLPDPGIENPTPEVQSKP